MKPDSAKSIYPANSGSILKMSISVATKEIVSILTDFHLTKSFNERSTDRTNRKDIMTIERFSHLTRRKRAFLVAVGLVFIIGLVDYATGDELNFDLFYFFPLVFVNWAYGKRSGIILSALSTFSWFLADHFSGVNYSHPFFTAWDVFIRLGVFLIVTQLVTKWRNALHNEKVLARKDFLTDIANSRAFYETAEKEIARCRRYGEPITLLYLDCDNFKDINDRFGHKTGDQLLQTVAGTLSRTIRSVDTAARLGGDEFGILMPETDLQSAQEMLSRIRSQLGGAMEKFRWPVTFSFGVATFKTSPSSVDEMIRAADRLMYQVKENGKNAFLVEAYAAAS
jgi:diguanylate cyclase (GGDEF)-like protein